MDRSTSATELREQMRAIRQNLQPEVDEIVRNTRDLVSWRYYVRSFPWASLGVATMLGYLVVPRKLEIESPDPETIAKLAKDNRLVVEHQPSAETKPGFIESLFNLTGSILLRAGVVYIGQQVGRYFGEEAAETASIKSP